MSIGGIRERGHWITLVVAGAILAAGSRTAQGGGLEEELSPPAPVDIAELDLEDLLKTPIVESATKRRQSLYEAPAAMDVFEGDEILEAGITSIADLLRRVPGVYVIQVSAGRINVGLRGVNGLANNRVLVLVNGRRLMELDHGSPSWQNFPIHVGEIDRIEVLRGPGTTLYGADGINGVINIATKRPLDAPGFAGLFAAGEAWLPDEPNDLRGARVMNLGHGYATYRASLLDGTLGLGVVAGWNHTPDWLASDAYAIQLHGDFGYHLATTLDWRPRPDTSAFVDLRHVESEGLRGAGDTLTTQRLFDYYSEQSLTVAFRQDHLLPNLSFSLNGDARRSVEHSKLYALPTGLGLSEAASQSPVLVTLEPANYRGHLVAQVDASWLGDRQVFSLAAEASYQETSRLFDNSATEWYYAGVLQSETLLLRAPRLLFNLGLRAEQVALAFGDKPEVRYGNLSPRASLIARLGENHTVRATLATAYRTPSIWEVSDLTFGDNAPSLPRNYFMRGNLSLRPEEVRSLELGYRGKPRPWMRVDAAAYYQRLRRPIQFLHARIPLMFENGPTTRQRGVELGLKIRPHRVLSGHLSYAFTQAANTETEDSLHDYPTHLLQLGGELRQGSGHLTVDLGFIAGTHLALMQSDLSGITQNDLTTSRQWLLNLRVGMEVYDGAAEFFVSGTNLLAFFRNRQDLVQFPSASADPIGALVLAGIRIRRASLGGQP